MATTADKVTFRLGSPDRSELIRQGQGRCEDGAAAGTWVAVEGLVEAGEAQAPPRRDSQRQRRRKGEMAAAAGGKETMRAPHILIKHKGSRCKASWKDP